MDVLIEELTGVVGAAGLLPADDVDRFITDWSGKQVGGAPLAVVRPTSTAEVAAVVRVCHDHGVAVVPQGGNTGLCGGSIPLADDHPEGGPSVVVSMERMKAIISLDVDRATATVEAGVTIQALQEAAATNGLLFAPDWGARGTAMIGGGIATNAGGLNVLRWGSMREQVLGLEVVLPDGRVWNGLRSLRKDATGMDLKQLFIGTEGTLGIVTAAVVRLHPLPAEHLTAFAALPSLEATLPLFAHARSASRGLLSAFELLPEEGVRRVLDAVPGAQRPLPATSEWYVLLRLSGGGETADTMTDLLATAADGALITDAVVASTAEQAANLWFIRDEIPPPFVFDSWGNRHKFDMAIPLDRVVDFFREAGPIVDGIVPGTKTYGFGHVGDGNLHFNIWPGPDCDLDEFAARGPELERAIDELTWSHGGTISAEHGVGQTMRRRLADQKSPIELDLLRTVKDALDPAGTMNPGKVIPYRSEAPS
jgi:FAD/FMN-containing dehydrogenase